MESWPAACRLPKRGPVSHSTGETEPAIGPGLQQLESGRRFGLALGDEDAPLVLEADEHAGPVDEVGGRGEGG